MVGQLSKPLEFEGFGTVSNSGEFARIRSVVLMVWIAGTVKDFFIVGLETMVGLGDDPNAEVGKMVVQGFFFGLFFCGTTCSAGRLPVSRFTSLSKSLM